MRGDEPAFPCDWLDLSSSGEQVVREQFPGVGVRLWLAAQAMQGLCANPANTCTLEALARSAVEIADELLKQEATR